MARIAFFVGLIVVIATELALSYFGTLDFPLHENSRELGYVPLPNQQGTYLRKYRWVFNELSMGVAESFKPGSSSRNILLIGDSNVMGLNSLDQAARLGPVMNAECPRIWPVGADSWAFLNELRYLHMHDDLLPSFNRIVFVLNFGDFGDASIWSSEITHPTHTPISSIGYLIRKLINEATDPAPTGDNDWRSEFAWLRQNYSGPITIALYPVKVEAIDAKERIKRLDVHKNDLGPGVTFIDLYQTPNWSISDYRDDFHATADGTRKIASFIVSKIPECH